MGKVQSSFPNGYPGAVTRSVDNVIISRKNASSDSIPFGAPVFLKSDGSGVLPFTSGTTTSDRFLGFTARVADKTPDTYDSNAAVYHQDDPVDILVRGAVALEIASSSAKAGDNVYIRIADNKLVTAAGTEGTTMQIPGAAISTPRDGKGCCEVVLRNRNLL